MFSRYVLLLGLLFVTAACGSEPAPVAAASDVHSEEGDVAFEYLLRLSNGPDSDRAQFVFLHENHWRSFWGEHANEPALDVDFSRHIVVAASLGRGPNGCFRLEFESMSFRDGVIAVVAAGSHRSCCGCMCTLLTTTPFIAATVERQSTSFEFSWKDVSVDCE